MIFPRRTEKIEKPTIKMANVNAGQPFKISWKRFKEADKVCSIEGKDSESCKKQLKEIGIEFVDD